MLRLIPESTRLAHYYVCAHTRTHAHMHRPGVQSSSWDSSRFAHAGESFPGRKEAQLCEKHPTSAVLPVCPFLASPARTHVTGGQQEWGRRSDGQSDRWTADPGSSAPGQVPPQPRGQTVPVRGDRSHKPRPSFPVPGPGGRGPEEQAFLPSSSGLYLHLPGRTGREQAPVRHMSLARLARHRH